MTIHCVTKLGVIHLICFGEERDCEKEEDVVFGVFGDVGGGSVYGAESDSMGVDADRFPVLILNGEVLVAYVFSRDG